MANTPYSETFINGFNVPFPQIKDKAKIATLLNSTGADTAL
jgi:hypothetical protein